MALVHRLLVLTCALLAACAGVEPRARAGTPAEAAPKAPARTLPRSLEVEDLDGRPVRPLEDTGAALHVLVFVSNDCPIANRSVPELRRLAERFQPAGVRFWWVHPRKDETREAIRQHAGEYRLPGRVLRDPGRTLTRAAGATVTPEAAVVDREGRLLYRGRIDDRFPAFGRERSRAAEHDLERAVEAGLQGRETPQPWPRAVGCTLSQDP